MKKKKLQLKSLEVKSFVTKQESIKGGTGFLSFFGNTCRGSCNTCQETCATCDGCATRTCATHCNDCTDFCVSEGNQFTQCECQ